MFLLLLVVLILFILGYWSDSKRNVLVDVYETRGENDVASLFCDINASEPVRLIDMPELDLTNVSSSI